MSTVLVTGGAGYVGAVLVPKLVARGHQVRVFDTYMYGREPLAPLRGARNLVEIEGDVRDAELVGRSAIGCDVVLHLACVSNDPSFDLDPKLGKSVNFESFKPLVMAAKGVGVRRFIYVSSSSVYGLSDAADVNEAHPLRPLTDYSRYKALCEALLHAEQSEEFVTLVIRPATVCGFSPRMRFDLSVNILTNHAVNRRKILVFGGVQTRPNIHIDDITDLYVNLIDVQSERIAGQTFNVGYANSSIIDLATVVRRTVEAEFPGPPIEIETKPTDDLRSYHVNSRKIAQLLGFRPLRTIEDAVRDLCNAFRAGRFPNSLEDPRYFNVALMMSAALA
jgi:nucleoside-diphosphate-sugar epimerase